MKLKKICLYQVFFRAPVGPLTGPDIDEILNSFPEEEFAKTEALEISFDPSEGEEEIFHAKEALALYIHIQYPQRPAWGAVQL